MAPATAAVSPIRSGGHVLDGILPHPGPARHLLRRHPRRRQRGPAAGGHPGRAAGDRADRRCADRSGRAAWRAPARPQAVDPGPHHAGGWGLHRRRRPAALWRHQPGARPPGHGTLHGRDFLARLHLRARPPARPAHRASPCQAWAAGAGPGDGPMTMDLDSTVCEVHGHAKQGAAYGYTHALGYHPLLATRADTGEVLHARQRTGRAKTARACRRHQIRYSITVRQTKPIRAAIAAIQEDAWVDIIYPDGGVAQVAETRYQGDRLIVRRTRLVGAQAELFPTWRYHAFVTDRVGTTVELDQDHRRHAVVELCIRDLKAGAGLRHCPSGKFNANAAWLVIATLAHNLLRWVAAIGLGARGELVVAKTLRRTLLALPGRITRSARRLILHLPAGWPWAPWFELALARLRCVAYAT